MLFLDLYALADVLWKLGKFFFNCSTCNYLQYNFFAIKQSFIHRSMINKFEAVPA